MYSGEPYFLVNPNDYQKYIDDFNQKSNYLNLAYGVIFFVSGELKKVYCVLIEHLAEILEESESVTCNNIVLKKLLLSSITETLYLTVDDETAAQIVAIKPNETVKEDIPPQEDNVMQTGTFLSFQLSDDPPTRFMGDLFIDEESQEVNNLPSDKVTPLEDKVIFNSNGAEVNAITDFAQELKIEFSIDDWSKCVKYAVKKYKQKRNIGGEVFIQTLTPIEDFLLKPEHYV